MGYRPEIDGLRAVAVLPVIAFHAGFATFGGGFVGVDVFFVISGFLITGLVWPEVAGGTFSLVRFYERRARRILPALYLVCAVTLAAAIVVLPPSAIADLLRSLKSVALFSSNLYFWTHATYFAPAAELTPLLHTWSLGVEEQFYLLFPLLLLALRRRSAKTLAAVLVALSAASLALAQLALRFDPAAAFYLLPTRAWELGAGAVVALAPAPRVGRRLGDAAAVAGLALIAAAIFAYGPATPFPGLAAVVPVGGACLVVAFARPSTLACAVLSAPPLVAIGLVSYSAYLWHQPLLALARSATPEPLSTAFALALCALSVGLAVPTWWFVERPFRNRARVGRRTVFAGAIAGCAALALIGAVGRGPATALSLLAYDARQRAVLDMIDAAKQAETRRGDLAAATTDCRFWTPTLDAATQSRLARCSEAHGGGLVVLGDSHAIDLFRAIAGASDAPFVVGLSDGGCRLGAGAGDVCFYAAFRDLLAAHPGLVRRVVFAEAGMYLLADDGGGQGSRTMFDRRLAVPFAPDRTAIAAVADYLATLAATADVAWFGPWVEPHVAERELVVRGCAEPPRLRPHVANSFAGLDRTIAATLAGRRVRYVSLVAALRFDPARDILDCGALYFADTDHWSEAGEARFGARLRDAGLLAPD